MKKLLTLAALLSLIVAVFLADGGRYAERLVNRYRYREETRERERWLKRVQRDDAYLLSAKEISARAPTTRKRFSSIRQLPGDIRQAFLDSISPMRIMEQITDWPLEEREKVRARLLIGMREWTVADRKDPWSGGCTAGEHFLEAGETDDGWWVFYEGGGLADYSALAIIKRVGGTPTVVGRFPVAR